MRVHGIFHSTLRQIVCYNTIYLVWLIQNGLLLVWFTQSLVRFCLILTLNSTLHFSQKLKIFDTSSHSNQSIWLSLHFTINHWFSYFSINLRQATPIPLIHTFISVFDSQHRLNILFICLLFIVYCFIVQRNKSLASSVALQILNTE